MTDTNMQYSQPSRLGRFSAEDAEALPCAELTPLARSQNPFGRSETERSVRDCALSPQTHQKECRHSDLFIASSPPPPRLCITHHFLSTPSLCTGDDRRCGKKHMAPQFRVSSRMLFTQDTPKQSWKSWKSFGMRHFKQGTVQREILAGGEIGAKFTAASTCLGGKKEKKWLLLLLVTARSMQVTQNITKSIEKTQSSAHIQLLLTHRLAKS